MRSFAVGSTALLLSLACGGRTPQDCPSGSEGCSCDPYGNCASGLACTTGVCEPTPVVSTGGSGGQGYSSASDPGRVLPPSATGGVLSLGGVVSGGVVGAGGVVQTGGTAGTGGMARTGGSPGAGGAIGTGGRTIVAAGGRLGVGGEGAGTVGTGGLGRGGMSGGAAGNTVTFANGRAEGAMTGYGWVALGEPDTLSAPTCGGEAVTSTSTCTSFEWPSPSGLCMSGSIPGVSGSADYSTNWGVMVAANASEPRGAGIGQSFESIAFHVKGTPSTSLRGILHRKGDGDGRNYCKDIRSGVSASLTSFNTSCWDGWSGTPLVAADVPNLDWIGVQVYSGASQVTVSNLCLTSIVLK